MRELFLWKYFSTWKFILSVQDPRQGTYPVLTVDSVHDLQRSIWVLVFQSLEYEIHVC